MSAGGKVTKANKEKTAKVIPSSQTGKVEANQANIRNQPTAEQIRLAQLTSDRSDGDPEIDKKVTQITELTGRSNDEALTALYDCDYDVNRAVEKILESQGDEADEWCEISKKKKVGPNKGSPTESQSELKTDRSNEQEMEQLNHIDSAPRGRRDRAPPRFNRGRGRGMYGGPDRVERSRENTSHEREQGFEATRGRRRGNFGEPRGRGGRRGGRSMHSNKFETQIDTWTNESAQNGDKDGTIGAWTDVTDEWTADEWNGSLKESCVFTPSASRSTAVHSVPNDASDGKSPSSVHQDTTVTYESTNQQTQLGGMSGDTTAGGVERTSYPSVPPSQTKAVVAGQESLSKQYIAKEPAAAKMAADCYGNMSDRTMYVSHYNKEATECIKNVMGIGRSSLSQNAPNVDAMSQPVVNQPLNNLQQSSQIQRARQPQPRPRLPPPSKIPSMPVEMPDSVNSGRVDLQFGNWDVAPLATDSNISFMSDIVPQPEYIGTSLISSPQSSSVSGTSIISQPTAASFESVASKSALATQDAGAATQAPKPSSHPSVSAPSSSTGESSLTKVVSIPPATSGLLTSVTKASGSTSSQLGFNQLASYSSPSVDGMASAGPKLPTANGPSHYGSSYNYQGGSGSLVTMSSDYNLAQGQMQYAYGDAQQRYGVNGPQAQPGFGPTSLPPGYSSGPLPNQLHYAGQQGPMKPFNVPEKPSGSYSAASDISVLYQSVAEKQGAPFPAMSQPTSYDVGAGYQSGAGFQSGNQPNSVSLPYPGGASGGISFQGLPMEAGGFEAGQYQNQSVYRPREGQAGYDMGGADSQRSLPTSGAPFSGAQGPASQQFGSNFGGQAHGIQSSGASYGPNQTPPSAGASFSSQGQSAQATSVTYGPQGQSAPASGSYGNQRQGTPSTGASAFGQGSQLYGNQGQAVQGATTTIAQSQQTGNVVSSNANASGKLVDNLSKLGLKDGQAGDSVAVASMSANGASASSASGAMMSSSSGVASSVAATTTNLASKTSVATTAKSSAQQTSKPLISIPPGMPGSAAAAAAAAAMVNPNYMIGQPPGFQLAAYGYPATQQPMTYTSYEELQMLQQRFQMPTPYYDMPLPTSANLPNRESSASLGAQTYAGNDVKLAAMDMLSPVNAQPTQQPQQVTGNQQAYINHALHPAYSYYYPGTGIMPVPSYYAQMVPMAIPSVTNPALAGTTSTTQYQKPTVFGSHAYALGGQTQDFSKTFGGSQVPNKPNVAGMASGIGGTSSDMMTGPGAFGKTHMQTYERGGFHAGTPPPSFSMALPSAGGNQAGAFGAPAVYGPPYMPLVPHQQSHSQLLHHAIPQDSAVAGRVTQPTAVQPKVGGNKPYSNTYWGSN